MTIFCYVNEVLEDVNGYTTYVLELAEESEIVLHGFKYLTCVKLPNWDVDLKIGDKGYVEYREIKEGVDTWFDGEKLIPYNYTFTQLINFVKYKQENHECVL